MALIIVAIAAVLVVVVNAAVVVVCLLCCSCHIWHSLLIQFIGQSGRHTAKGRAEVLEGRGCVACKHKSCWTIRRFINGYTQCGKQVELERESALKQKLVAKTEAEIKTVKR